MCIRDRAKDCVLICGLIVTLLSCCCIWLRTCVKLVGACNCICAVNTNFAIFSLACDVHNKKRAARCISINTTPLRLSKIIYTKLRDFLSLFWSTSLFWCIFRFFSYFFLSFFCGIFSFFRNRNRISRII